ncbi:hypothetical protein R1flu_021299 [Riccia fluitans]|uniref:Uncharacterized protein n=1 Tax=Riccia fluitans TaxID=41844 RepID=A0ABD1ZQN2_9MARC
MAAQITRSQVYSCLSGWNLQLPAARSSEFLLSRARQVTRWQCVRIMRTESVSSYSFADSKISRNKSGRKISVKAGNSKAIKAEKDALQLLETAEKLDLLLPTDGEDEDSPQGEDRIAQELADMTGTISISEHVPIAVRSVCVGIDPDLSGAIAVLRTEDNTTSAEVIDVPCVTVSVNKKMRRRHDYQAIAALVRQLQAPEGSIAFVEQAMPFPKDGKQGWYITGYGYGVWLGILAAAGFTVIPVQAKVWKTALRICGKEFTKDDSRALASSLFPALSLQLRRKKDHGRAEALLIAAFGKGMALPDVVSEDLSSEVVVF